MPPSSERSSGSPSQLLSAPGLRVVALVLFVLFATLVAGALWPVQLLNPIWQRRLAGSLVNGAPFALLGLALLQIAVELGPHDPLLKSRQRLCSQLAVIKVPPREPGDHELCQSRYRHCREASSGGGITVIIQATLKMNHLQYRERIATICTRFSAFLGISTSIILVAPIGHAAVVVTASEVGGNVVFSGGGTLNLSDLNPVDQGCFIKGFLASRAGVYQGGGSQGCDNAKTYGPVTGPTNFGNAFSFTIADNLSGDFAGINPALGGPVVPDNYISGSSIFSTSTYLAETFQSLGLIPGVYEWTWGTTNPDSYKLIIGQPAAVPGPLPLVGAAAAFGFSRRLRKRIAAPLSTPPQA